MSTSSHQMDEMKELICSSSKTNKSLGYTSLLHFQEHTSGDSSSIEALAQSSCSLIHCIVVDISDDDEEIAAQALKCLGFMIYHPSLVASISVDDAGAVLQSLAKLIVATKMKSICNLGVWCISIQQFDSSILAIYFDSLLMAVIHALDNPIGSLSTTFEALQAVTKLVAQLSERMRELSHLWAPSICRRLLSTDKKEMDMSERCLLKIKSTLFPPTLALSKALLKDMKQKLVPEMKNLISRSMKVQTIQAWGWFIRLLGYQAMKKNRHFVNDLLKIPELTFRDQSPQVQIASLVSWEGLIDTLIHVPSEPNTAMDGGNKKMRTSEGVSHDIQEGGLLKSLKLIMTPLLGIISSKCDVSVRSACWNAWCYLLHKLDTSINCPLVMKLVLDPILEAVLQIGPYSRNLWFWNQSVELLDDFILAKCKVVDCESNSHVTYELSTNPALPGSISSTHPWKQCPIKWLPWNCSQVDYFISIIDIITRHVSGEEVSVEDRDLACDAALRVFRSVLKGVRIEFRKTSLEYRELMLCLNSILRFVKKIFEDSEGSGCSEIHQASMLFVQVISEELEPALVGSPLYKVALDLKVAENWPLDTEIRLAKVLGISDIAYMDMVSPLDYLMAVHFSVLVNSTLNAPNLELVLQQSCKYFQLILSLYNPMEVLCFSMRFLCKSSNYRYMQIWIAITTGLMDWIDSVKDNSTLNVISDEGSSTICHLLSYPFVIFSYLSKNSSMVTDSSEKSAVPSLTKLELECVTEVWKSLYSSVRASRLEWSTRNSFMESLCSILNGCLDNYTSILKCCDEVDSSFEEVDHNLLSLSGEVVICMLEDAVTSNVNSRSTSSNCNASCKNASEHSYILGFSSSVMKLAWMKTGAEPTRGAVVGHLISRVFSALAHFASCLDLQQHILSFTEIISCPLLQWLSLVEKIEDQPTKDEVQLLWTASLNSLTRSQPPINFNSSFLKSQADLLEKTLDHPNTSISKPTINFWNSTYGKQPVFQYPENMLHVLDKLSRNGSINLYSRSHPILKRCHSAVQDISPPKKYKVTATHNRSSKRIELTDPRRKKLELTEHQKEVRRAQQGKERDCGGHGPGIRTYTSVDFSQGNEDSQESQDSRNPEAILEMLRRVT